MADTTKLQVEGTDEQGKQVQLRMEVNYTGDGGAAAKPKYDRVPTVIPAGAGTKLDDAGNFTIKIPSEMSGGAYFIFEAVLPPGTGVQLHKHVLQDELLYLLEGQMELQLGDKIYQMSPGSLGNFTRGVPHGFHNNGSTRVRAVLTVIPGGLERFFEQTRTITDPATIVALAAQYGMQFLGPVFVINSLGMRMIQVLPGEYDMGSPDSDSDANQDEKPGHKVKITKPFWMGMHTVTRGQFRKFVEETGYLTEYEENGEGSYGIDLATGIVGPNPRFNWLNGGFPQADDHPVICVSWNDANRFCRWLGKKEGKRYRLPTEAEWEYACRGGTTTRFCNGDPKESVKVVGNVADQCLASKWKWRGGGTQFRPGQSLPPWAEAWNDGFAFTAPVGSFQPNAWGFYDMHGNVGEWCSDWYDENYYKVSPAADPQGPATPEVVPIADRAPGKPPRTLRVIRGGVWLDSAVNCRCADRWTHRRHPVDSAADIGFRVVSDT